MKLSEKAIEAINTPRVRSFITIAHGKSEKTTERYIAANEDNGPLTSVGIIAVIRRETGLTDDEILISEKSIV